MSRSFIKDNTQNCGETNINRNRYAWRFAAMMMPLLFLSLDLLGQTFSHMESSSNEGWGENPSWGRHLPLGTTQTNISKIERKMKRKWDNLMPRKSEKWLHRCHLKNSRLPSGTIQKFKWARYFWPKIGRTGLRKEAEKQVSSRLPCARHGILLKYYQSGFFKRCSGQSSQLS